MRAERHGFEYKRSGTLSLYAALNTRTGQVRGKTAARHSSTEFVAFLGEVVSGSTADLARKLRRYINAYSKDAKPFRWKYSATSRRSGHENVSAATLH